MQSRRVVVLVISVVLGAIAALAVFSYLQGTQDRANKGAALVQVLVVKRDVPKGLPFERASKEGYIGNEQVPAKLRPVTAVVKASDLAGKVAIVALPANQVVVEGLFVDQRVAQVTNSQRVQPGRVAVSVSLDAVKAVNGLLVPGDKVNIMVRFARATAPGLQLPAGGDAGLMTLYQNVEVLFIGSVAAPQAGETQAVANPGSGVITFSVPAEAAQRIVLASSTEGGLYLALVPPDNPERQIAPITSLLGPPCSSIGPDNVEGTADDTPRGCIPLTPYTATPTTTPAPAPATKP